MAEDPGGGHKEKPPEQVTDKDGWRPRAADQVSADVKQTGEKIGDGLQ